MELIIVPASVEKIWDKVADLGYMPAKDAFIRAAFKRWRQYAEDSGNRWVILSPKYGFLDPDQMIGDYQMMASEVLDDPDFHEKLRNQAIEKKFYNFDKLVVLDWELYHTIVSKAFAEAEMEIELKKM